MASYFHNCLIFFTIVIFTGVKATPFGISLTASVATGVAWYNFDRFEETKSGKNTFCMSLQQ